MRRMNGRSPPFISVGLFFIIIILSYNLWTYSSMNDDLTQENKKLQQEIKLSGAKQEQYEKKAQLLQQNIYELDSKSVKLNKEIETEEHKLSDAQTVIKSKDEMIKSLQDEVTKLEEAQRDLKLQVEERDSKILQLNKESHQVIDMKNEAEEIISERDEQIKKLQQLLEQTKMELSMVKAQKPSLKQVPGSFNIPGALTAGSKKTQSDSPKSDGQIDAPHESLESKVKLPDVQSVIQNPKHVKLDEELSEQKNVGVLPKPQPESLSKKQESRFRDPSPQKRVLPLPPQNNDDNLDAAIDEDMKAMEDQADDQDEEGKEIQHDLIDPGDEDAAAEEKDPKQRADDFNNGEYDMDLAKLRRKKIEQPGHQLHPMEHQQGIENRYIHMQRYDNRIQNSYDTHLSNRIRNFGTL